MNLYDRYFAICENKCEGKFVLLCSISTLYIAIKLHEPKSSLERCNLSELSKLSRGHFRTKDIENMELNILHSLSWLVNPPLATDFIHLVLNLPSLTSHSFVHQQVFESSQYMVELTVCDPFFIESSPSVIAFAAILNALEEDIDYLSFSSANRSKFLQEVRNALSLNEIDREVCIHRKRMQKILLLQDETMEEVKKPQSPLSVCDPGHEFDEHDQRLTNQYRHLRGHRRSSSADNIDFSTLNENKRRRHRRSSSVSSDLRRISISSG